MPSIPPKVQGCILFSSFFCATFEYICHPDAIFSREWRFQDFNMEISFNKETKVSLSITLTGSSPHPSYVQTECELTVCGHCVDQAAHCCRLLLTLIAYTRSDVQPISSIVTYIIHTPNTRLYEIVARGRNMDL